MGCWSGEYGVEASERGESGRRKRSGEYQDAFYKKPSEHLAGRCAKANASPWKSCAFAGPTPLLICRLMGEGAALMRAHKKKSEILVISNSPVAHTK